MGYMVMVMDYMDVMIMVPPQHEYHSAHPLLPQLKQPIQCGSTASCPLFS